MKENKEKFAETIEKKWDNLYTLWRLLFTKSCFTRTKRSAYRNMGTAV